MKKIALNPNDLALLKNYLTFGLKAGVGVGAGAALLNQLHDIATEARGSSPLEKDVLRIKIGPRPKDEKAVAKYASLMRGPLALTLALLGATSGYVGARKLHQMYKKKELEKDLDQAQNSYINVLGEAPQTKAAAAGQPMSKLETLTSLPPAVAILMGLASAAVANQTLQHTFPDRKPGTRLMPRRVVISQPREGASDDTETLAAPKSAALAHLVDTVTGWHFGNSDVEDVVAAAGAGRFEEMRKVARDLGFEAMLNTVRGASKQMISHPRLKLASLLLCSDPELAPSLGVLANAEFGEGSPLLRDWGNRASPELQDRLIKFATTLSSMYNAQIVLPRVLALTEVSKSAAAAPAPVAIQQLLAQMLAQPSAQLPMEDIPMEGLSNDSGTLDVDGAEDPAVAAPAAV